MNFILFDEPIIRQHLLPFTFTRPVASIRVGIVTIKEKWEHFLQTKVSFLTEGYLQKKFPSVLADKNIFINGAVLPNDSLLQSIGKLNAGERLVQQNTLLAVKTYHTNPFEESLKSVDFQESFQAITQLWDIFLSNGEQINADFQWITAGRTSELITDSHTKIYKPEAIFVEAGVEIRASILNAENGVIYLGKNATIQENSVIRSNFAMLEGSSLSMGAKMRGDITLGPYCKVGGEVSNSILFANSNKSHEGYLGNSVLGEWCNLGADTNTSNMKNDYGNIKIWNYPAQDFKTTGRQFCGTMMGDHSKAGINTMFNTGTVVGVNCNVFGGGFPPKYIPSFSWGGADCFEQYGLEKALEVASRMMQRRGETLEETDKEILRYLFQKENQ
ncbi:MAG: GlmU family protein [Verrucomicrobia bacterium]|nr:GlmU family protein [Cytophagales bacterium]